MPFDNDRIGSETPNHSSGHKSKSKQNEKELTDHMTVDTDAESDAPIRGGGRQPRSIQKEKTITHHTAIDTEDETESTSDSYIEIVEKPGEDAEAELGQLC